MATPTITDPDPVPGDFSTDRESDRMTVVTFTHTVANASAVPIVWVKIASQVYMIYDGEGFVDLFAGTSTVDDSGDPDFVFAMIPSGGWWGQTEFFSADGYLSEVA